MVCIDAAVVKILGGLAMSLYFFIVDVRNFVTDDETSVASLAVRCVCYCICYNFIQ
jgi:hypothetical protein